MKAKHEHKHRKEKGKHKHESKLCRECRFFRYGAYGYSTCGRKNSATYGQKLPHNGKIGACDAWELMTLEIGRCLEHSGLHCIEDLRGHHKDAEIWILGCGPSLDDFPIDFFEGRIAIAVKYSMARFAHCTYNMFAYRDLGPGSVAGWVKEGHLDMLKNSIVTIRREFSKRPVWPGGYGKYPYYMRVFKGRARFWLERAAKCVIEGKPCIYPGVNTIAHHAMFAAIVMGARKITLVGCDACTGRWRAHAEKDGMKEVYMRQHREVDMSWIIEKKEFGQEWQDGTFSGYQDIRNGVKWLKELFEPRGVEISRYFYGKGYEKGLYTLEFEELPYGIKIVEGEEDERAGAGDQEV